MTNEPIGAWRHAICNRGTDSYQRTTTPLTVHTRGGAQVTIEETGHVRYHLGAKTARALALALIEAAAESERLAEQCSHELDRRCRQQTRQTPDDG